MSGEQKFDYDVFLSYSSEDKTTVCALAERLKKDGLRIWLDEWVIKPGDSIPGKIIEGIEGTRTLVMCMSPAYFESQWGTLEHHTLLFRDPTNAQRRFIPLLIADCTPPDVIAQFAHIDWRTTSDEAYEKLLVACRLDKPEIEEPSTPEPRADNSRMVLKGHEIVQCVAVTPNGTMVVSGSIDMSVELWDMESGKRRATLKGHTNGIPGVAATPDGKNVISTCWDGTLKVWSLETTRCIATLHGTQANNWGVAISGDGRTVVSGTSGRALGVWDLKTKQLSCKLQGHTQHVRGVAISHDGRIAVSGSLDKTLKVWDLDADRYVNSLRGHTASIEGVAITPDAKTVVSGSADNTLKVWDIETGQCRATFEGHAGGVLRVAITPDGKRIVSASNDNTVKVWDLATGRCSATLEGHTSGVYGLAVTPDGKTVISCSADKTLRVWDLPAPDMAPEDADAARYTNAKVLLVGDSGVGKSGLAVRLTEDEFKPTISTDAHWATQFKLPHKTGEKDVNREIWLWDFAGQADYRLTHQLFMDETELAALVFNPQHENPFEGLGQWDSDLEKAARRPFKKLLVAGRCDRGGLMVTKKSIEDFRKQHSFAKYIETSARTGEGCDELRKAIIKNIDWKSIPWTASSRIFKVLKDEIIKLREEGTVLLRMIELKQQLQMRLPDESFTIDELRSVVGLLAGPGIVWKLEFGDFVLLQPERINAYASAVVRKVRKHTDEIGCILEQDIVDGNLDFQDTERLELDEEAIVLRAMHQTFIDHGICLRQETDRGTELVLPSLFKRERPELEGHPAIFVSYEFSGNFNEIYASLVVRLHHTSAVDNDKLWKFAADFLTPSGKRVGVKMSRKHEGVAELLVYCDPKVPDDTKVTFIKYVHEHLLRKGVQVKRYRHHVCDKCGHPVKDSELAREILDEKGKRASISCQKCNKKVPLWDLIEDKFASEESQLRVRELEEQATAGIDSESKELILMGHAYAIAGEAGQIYRQYTNSDHGIDGEIEFKNNKGQASGKRLYLQLKSGDSYLRTRKGDGKEIFRIKKKRWAEYWLAQAYPVMLVIRTSDGHIRWMNVTDYLQEHGANARQIVLDGEPFTALNVVKLRSKLLGQE
ncbi:MAG: TIR domain-containing protein [Planctomycetota bacterium]|jgi:small GTP-binding protein